MKVVIVHYHLRPGGVTGVIRQQVLAINEAMPEASITVLCGEGSADFDSLPCDVSVAEELCYFVPESPEVALEYEKRILRSCIEQITDEQTIFHFHNPTLGKNPCVTGAISSLADRRVPIVSTCHDFSEDRPLNQEINERYASWCGVAVEQFLYPDRGNISYFTINRSDFHRDHWSQLVNSSVAVMHPPVQALGESTISRSELASWLTLDLKKEWVFYPVRAIKRKNIGEFLLLALLDEGRHEWLLARAPQNEIEKPLYREWVELAEQLNIPVRFDVVETVPFQDLMTHSNRIITTSVREGFGMAYLEPWYAGKPVAGRELTMVVDDMRSAGVFQDQLYDEVPVPVGDDRWEDFGFLSIEEQMDRLRALASSPELCEEIRQRGTWWQKLWSVPTDDVFEENYRVVDEEFSRKAFGRKLKEHYKNLV